MTKAKGGEHIPANEAKLREAMAKDAAMPIAKLDLGQVRKMIQRMVDLQAEIAKHQELIDQRQKQLYKLQTEDIPTLFDQVGVAELTLDQWDILIKTEIHPQVLKADEPKFFDWLRAHDYGSLIKNEVKVTFGRGEDTKAEQLMASLLAKKYAASQKQTVHAGTLKAFVKEQLEKIDHGEKVPKLPAVLNINPVRTTHVKTKEK